MHSSLHIALAAERLFTLWGVPITNTLIAEWVVMVLLIIIAIVVGRKPTLVPGKVQNFFEILFDYVLNYMEQILGNHKLAVRFFPLIVTIFVFIAFSNLFDFIPLFGSIVYHSSNGVTTPLLRGANTDLNATLALAIISVFTVEISGIVILGAGKYASKFFNFTSVTGFFVGLIEFVSEMARFITFSFRLFGNIFAGEVLLGVAGMFMPYALPVPLMAFEGFDGLIQAAVFAMLTLFFIKLAIAEPHFTSHKKEESQEAHPTMLTTVDAR